MEAYRPVILTLLTLFSVTAILYSTYAAGRDDARKDFFEHTAVVVGYPKVYNQVFFGKCAAFENNGAKGEACAVKFIYP